MDAAQRGCSVEGCTNTHRAKGLCASHYNVANGFRSKNYRYPIVCAWCGVEHMSARKTGYACCNEHRGWVDSYRASGPSTCGLSTDHPARMLYNALRRKTGPSCRVFFTVCVVCSSLFATPYTVKTCSPACAKAKRADDKREIKHRRRARERAAFVSPVSRRAIYARDAYTCKLCGKPLDMNQVVPHPLAPTIDHVTPLAKGGTHEPSNVQAAHFQCNSIKGDREAASTHPVDPC